MSRLVPDGRLFVVCSVFTIITFASLYDLFASLLSISGDVIPNRGSITKKGINGDDFARSQDKQRLISGAEFVPTQLLVRISMK